MRTLQQVRPLPVSNALAVAMGLLATGLVAGGWIGLVGLTVLTAAAFLGVYLMRSVIQGNGDGILGAWVLLFPLGYYFLSYPRDRSAISFDRLMVLILMVCAFVARRERRWDIPREMRLAGITWGIFLAVGAISFARGDLLPIGRVLIDIYLLPALLGWYVIRQFRVQQHARWVHFAICIVSLYSCTIGVAELLLQRDLLPFALSVDYLAGSPDPFSEFVYLRANGPFRTNDSFALIGIISFFLLMFLWQLAGKSRNIVARLLHHAGCAAALLQALLPLFRSVYVTLLLFLVIDVFWTKGWRRVARVLAVVGIPAVIAVLISLAPGVASDRLDPANAYGRIAQNEQNLAMFLDHPIFGIGVSNFVRVATQAEYQAHTYMGTEPVNSPHSNLAWVGVENGILGLAPYLVSQVVLVWAFWRLRRRGESGAQAWRYFQYIFLAYWVTGLTETTGAEADVNIWFVFAASLLYRYGWAESLVSREEEDNIVLPVSMIPAGVTQ